MCGTAVKACEKAARHFDVTARTLALISPKNSLQGQAPRSRNSVHSLIKFWLMKRQRKVSKSHISTLAVVDADLQTYQIEADFVLDTTVPAKAEYPNPVGEIGGYSANVTTLCCNKFALLGNVGEFWILSSHQGDYCDEIIRVGHGSADQALQRRNCRLAT